MRQGALFILIVTGLFLLAGSYIAAQQRPPKPALQATPKPYVIPQEMPDLRPMVEALNPNQELIEASRNGQDGIVDQLLQRNVPPGWLDQENRTALHYAALNGHAYIAEQLVRHGANLYAIDNQGRTPLHLAAMQGHSDMVKTLLRLGANQEMRDSSGLRPVDYALRGGHSQTAESFTLMPSNTPVMRTAVLPAAAWVLVSIRLLLFLIMPLVLLLSFILVFRRRPRPVPLRPDHDRLQQMARLAERMEARIANLETILTAQPDGQTTHTGG